MAWDNIRYSNSGAVRNQPITDELAERLSEAVTAVYGPGAYAQVYSGGQPAKGSGGKRVGSTRHDNGMAADIHFYDANGNQITSDADLGRVGQYWLAKGYGSAGMEMHGGGVHLDQHTDRATHWNYADEGGRYTDAERAAIAAGLQGQLPPLYGQPPGTTSALPPGSGSAPAPGITSAPAPGSGPANNQQGNGPMTMDAEYARQQALRAALNAGELPSAGDQLNTMMPGAGNPAPGGAPGNDLMLRPSGPNVGAFDPHRPQPQMPPQMPQPPTLVQPQQAGFMANWLNNPLNQFGARLMAASDPSGTSGASQMGRTIIDTQAAMSAQNATQLQAQMERLKINAQIDAMMKDQLQTMKRREIASKLRKAGYGADADYIDMGGDFGKLIGIGGNGGVTVNVGPTKSQEYSQAGVFGAADPAPGAAPAPEGAGAPPGNDSAPDGTGPAPGGSSGYQLDPDLRPMAQVDAEQAVKIQEARNKQRNNQEFSQQQQEQRQQDRVDIAKHKQEVAAATIDDGIKAVDDLLTLFDEHGTEGAGWFSDGNIQGQYDALRIQVLRAAADLQNAGVLQQGEYERINEQLPDPASFGSVFKKNNRIKSSYTTLRKLLERKRNSIAGDNGHAQFMPEASTAPMSDAYGGAYNPDTGEIE